MCHFYLFKLAQQRNYGLMMISRGQILHSLSILRVRKENVGINICMRKFEQTDNSVHVCWLFECAFQCF